VFEVLLLRQGLVIHLNIKGMQKKMIITDWAESDQPRQKLLRQGRRIVTDAELLAILIGSGSRQETAVDLCKRILNSVSHDLLLLSKLEVHELCQFAGIGEAKAISIIAALELGRRRQDIKTSTATLLNSSRLAYEYLKNQMQDLPHEEFWVIYLNTACHVIDKQMIGKGGNDFTPVDTRIILRHGLINKAHAMILAHNHPSGTLKPSKADVILTTKIIKASKEVDILVHDHLIFTENNYFSFRDKGLLEQ